MSLQKKKPFRKEFERKFGEKPKISINYNVDATIDDLQDEVDAYKSEKVSIKELRDEKLKLDPKPEKKLAEEKKPEEKSKSQKDFFEDEKKTSRIFLWVSVIIIIALIVVIINLDKIVPKKEIPSSVVATVNGQSIEQTYLDRMYSASVPSQYQATISKDDFLRKSMIPQEVLVQEAERNGFSVTEVEVKKVVNDLVVQSGMTEQQFQERLQADNISIDDIYELYRTNILVNKLLNYSILSDLEVNIPERVKASHILVDTEAEAKEIIASLKKGEEFNRLAMEKSKDPSAKTNGGDLGYFQKGVMVPAFETAAFSLPVGEISDPVKTDFGYHVIRVDDKQPAKVVKYSELANADDKQNAYEQNRQVVQTYIDALVARADIKIGENVTESQSSQPVQPNDMKPADKLDIFTSCLSGKDVSLYVSQSCDFSDEQSKLLGDGISKINTIICYDGKTDHQTSQCENLGIEGYPTWIINGKQLKGVQSLETLSKESGCSLG